MKKCLIICYDYPPNLSAGGSVRVEKFMKYLPRYGWQPTVLTCAQSEAAVALHDEGVVRLRARLGRTEGRLWVWLPKVAWFWFRRLRHQQYVAILFSGPPFYVGVVAALIARFSRLPLVSDFRDAWSLNPYRDRSALHDGLSEFLQDKLTDLFERVVISSSACLVVNTPSMQREYARTFPMIAEKLVHIPNGYDESDFAALGVSSSSSTNRTTFNLVHLGLIGVSYRPLEPLCAAVAEVLTECPQLRLRLVGPILDGMLEIVKWYNLEKHVVLVGNLEHSAALREMCAADALLLYQGGSTAGVSAVAGKTFEYLRAGRPILVVAPSGDNLSLVQEYSDCCFAVSECNTEKIAAALKELYGRWKEGLLPRVASIREEFVGKYERAILSRQLAEVLDALIT